jgi:multiple sugar transport system permease protein
VYYIFLMRQTFQTIPKDFEEAARVDGANTVQILWHIYVPMIIPAIAVMVIFQSVAMWNDYQWPLIAVGGNQEVWPVALGFQRLMATPPQGLTASGVTTGSPNYPYSFTVAAIATIPTVLLYLFFQRYFVEGIQGFAIKG